MDFSKVIATTIPEGKVAKIEDNEGRVLWSTLPDPNKYAYGIRWDHTVPDSQATTACERIGNLELHKTLPIQSKFATCIHQGTDIKYWCDPNDSRFRKDNTGYRIVNERIWLSKTTDAEKNAVPSDYSPSSTYNYTIQFPNYMLTTYEEAKLLVTTYKYLYAWVKINDTVIGRVNKVDTVNKKAYITTESVVTGETIIPTLEFGCSINGYDGEISVYTPKFYIWSVDNDGAGNEVWQSEKKCVPYAREVKPHIISIGRVTLLTQAMDDDKWGWLNTLSENTAVSVCNYRPELRGGNGDSSFDQYVGKDNFRTLLGKGISIISLDMMRKASQKIENCQVLYYQIWSAIVWCYFIEYADFNVKKAYTNNLTSEGYHQGGLGYGLTHCNKWHQYNDANTILSIDYTLELGNKTGIKTKPAINYDFENTTMYLEQFDVPHYRGFNGFWYGDTFLNIENFLSKYDSISDKRKFYFTDDVNKFSDNITNKENVIEVDSDLEGWAKEIVIGNKADLITNKVGNQNFINCYREDNTTTSIHTTLVGGSAERDSYCGLAHLYCPAEVDSDYSDVTFAKCCILD